MRREEFDYELPDKYIAQNPIDQRDHSKLMVIDRKNDTIDHKIFKDIISYLKPGDTLVLNESKVMPSRIFGHRPAKDEKIEVLLLTEKDGIWEAMVKPGKKLKEGREIIFSSNLKGQVVGISDIGTRYIKLDHQGELADILNEIGQMPTPPYIKEKLEEKDSYQTVFAKSFGSAAAPTAGLHFTKEILKEISNKGVNIAKLTLHVGLGTFRPVYEDNIEDHPMHSEYYKLDEENARLINKTIENKGRIIAVGTTSVRTLETIANKYGKIQADQGQTDIFIYPPYEFKVIDGLITNFHLPESTLLMLVSAFYDRKKLLKTYEIAKEENYRFFSFGDAMFIY